ncbi:hypothetical protein PFISCL1PPCAC_28949, partial [Pristionchus fissidentatus]
PDYRFNINCSSVWPSLTISSEKNLRKEPEHAFSRFSKAVSASVHSVLLQIARNSSAVKIETRIVEEIWREKLREE